MIDVYYMVVPVNQATTELLSNTATRTLDAARKSTDGTLCILEVEGQIPEELWAYQAIPFENMDRYLQENEELWGDQNGDGQIGLMGQFLNLFRLS